MYMSVMGFELSELGELKAGKCRLAASQTSECTFMLLQPTSKAASPDETWDLIRPMAHGKVRATGLASAGLEHAV